MKALETAEEAGSEDRREELCCGVQCLFGTIAAQQRLTIHMATDITLPLLTSRILTLTPFFRHHGRH